jgi:DNA-binding CsgD family transcriptional regulator
MTTRESPPAPREERARSAPFPIALSAREREIASMVAAGHPNKTIACALEISTFTVSTHLRRVFAKLGVSSRAAMVARLMAAGVIRTTPG